MTPLKEVVSFCATAQAQARLLICSLVERCGSVSGAVRAKPSAGFVRGVLETYIAASEGCSQPTNAGQRATNRISHRLLFPWGDLPFGAIWAMTGSFPGLGGGRRDDTW